jgi:putative copper export protein
VIEALLPPLQRTLLFAGVLLLTGTVVWRGAIAPRVRFELSGKDPAPERELTPITDLEERASRLAAWVALALVAVWGLRLVVQVMAFRDPFAPLGEDVRFLILETFWGTVWMGQGLVLVLLVPTFGFLATRAGSTPPPPPGLTPEGVPRTGPPALELPLRWKAAALLVALLLLTLGLSSHAMSVPSARPMAVSVDLAHTLAAGSWMGSLSLILATTGRGEEAGALLAAQLRGFSPVAVVSVGMLVFMGIVLAGFHVHEIPALWQTRYGLTLAAKVGVAGIVMGVGLWNWRWGLPMLGDDGDGATPAQVRMVRRSASLEILLAGVVLVVTAVLVATPVPPGAH